MDFPPLGSADERAHFLRLQDRLPDIYRQTDRDDRCDQTVVVVPSLSMDPRELAKVSGVHHYEERLLFFLMLLRKPRTRLIYVTSQPISPTVIDYYLHLLSGVPTSHARKRLVLFDASDASALPLSAKLLARPRLMGRIRNAITPGQPAHMVCFNSTKLERSVAVRLGIPLYANDPELDDLGSKSGCRETFREAGVPHPDGFERLRDEQDMAKALTILKLKHPSLRRAVVKLNHGFSGEGNAIFNFQGIEADTESALLTTIKDHLPELKFEAPAENWESFSSKFREMQGVAECFVEGDQKRSPSSQCRVDPLGRAISISTHDQVLGGPSGQVFLGATFPADAEYRLDVQTAGMHVAEVLARKGARGRFATDFVSVPKADGGYEHYAIEVNLRKGGTTHPFETLRFLTDGQYDERTGEFFAPSGKPKCYFASDTLQSAAYVGLLPDDLIDISVYHDLHFHASSERGVVFHLVGALSQFGKLGLVGIGDNLQQAKFLYRQAIGVLDHEVGSQPVMATPSL